MRLDINRLKEINEELEKLEIEDRKICNDAREKYGENWIDHAWEQIKKLENRKDELKNEATIVKATNVDVGDGLSLCPWTDWNAYTVIARKDTPKGFTLTIQQDDAIRTDNNGMSDSQTYRFEKNPHGRIETVKWSTKKNWFTCGRYIVALGRHCYYDYSF